MLETVDLAAQVPREAYREQRDGLVAKLVLLQQQASQANVPVILVFEGWDASGKGSRIGDLAVDLDPRLFEVHTVEKPVGYEKRKPFMQRFWEKIGPHGTMTIFDHSWYSRAVHVLATGKPGKKSKLRQDEFSFPKDRANEPYGGMAHVETEQLISSINSLEKQFADDGYIIVKFFLHISKEEQLKRLLRLSENEATAWRATKSSFRENERYDKLCRLIDRIMEKTNYSYAPWNVISGMDSRAANLEILKTLIAALERGLGRKAVRDSLDASAVAAESKTATADNLIPSFPLVKVPSLGSIERGRSLGYEAYREKLKEEQRRLGEYHGLLHERQVPLIIAFEGWGAAGIGGNIKRIAKGMDARGYRVIAAAEPSWSEKHHPFLWRYWVNLPRNGHIAIFDRSWYGRVLADRIEGNVSKEEWQRAYDEINEFEWELQQWGAILIKFWLSVSPAEQLRRLEERKNDPLKTWKLTEGSWRSNDNYQLYRQVSDDAIRLTSTDYAPWQVIDADNKQYARVETIKAINEALSERLEQ